MRTTMEGLTYPMIITIVKNSKNQHRPMRNVGRLDIATMTHH